MQLDPEGAGAFRPLNAAALKGHDFSRAAKRPQNDEGFSRWTMQPILAVILSERSIPGCHLERRSPRRPSRKPAPSEAEEGLRLPFAALNGHGFKACPEPVEGCRNHPTRLLKSISAAKPRPDPPSPPPRCPLTPNPGSQSAHRPPATRKSILRAEGVPPS